jgi:hypothetical protein
MIAALLLLAAQASQASIPVEVGRFDPANFPRAKMVDRRMPEADLVRRVDAIMADKQCAFEGQSKDSYDIVVPYAVLMGAGGGATSRIVVKDVGCPAVETLVGEVANALVKAGDFRPNPFGGERWYVSEIGFAHGGEALAQKMKDDNRIVCEQTQPKVGSRLGAGRVCRTVAEWRVYGIDREQLQRDLKGNGQRAVEGPGAPKTNGYSFGQTCANPLRC